MGKTDFAEAYTEKMFPEVASPAGRIDPEFEDISEGEIKEFKDKILKINEQIKTN